MTSVNIISIGSKELKQLLEISINTFLETFSESNNEADMNLYLQQNMTLQKLEQEMHTPGSTFYFAVAGNEVAGYLKTNTGAAQTEMKDDEKSLEVERIYVLQKYQGMQIGRLLMKHAIDMANAKQMNKVWLGVWEHNHKAIQFYQKHGFVTFGKHAFVLGNDPQTDIMMKLDL